MNPESTVVLDADVTAPSKSERVMAELSAGVRGLTESGKWQAYLDTQSKFHSYSFGNAVLIGIQKPDATRVAGFNKWKELGRQVRKGEHGASILAPIIRTKKDEGGDKEKDHKYVAGFTSATVFDVRQTDGEPLPEIAPLLTGVAPEGQFRDLTSVAGEFGFSVEKRELTGGTNGYCSPSEKLIVVESRNDEVQQVKTLAHELGHALLHEEGNDLPREHKEIEAESVAYVVSQALGINSGEYSFGYLTSWGHGDPEAVEKQLKSSGQRIQKASHQIIEQFGKVPVNV
jgi:antirestriction protein ArdC